MKGRRWQLQGSVDGQRRRAPRQEPGYALKQLLRTPVCTENLDPGVVVMKSAKDRV
jgi:hypothetical protein